MMCVLCFLKLP